MPVVRRIVKKGHVCFPGHGTRPELTVACNNQKFIIIGKLVDNNVGVCGNDLLLGSKLCALLEFEIANGSGEGQVAVDPSKVDETAGSGDSCLLACRKEQERKSANQKTRSNSKSIGL